MTALAITHIVYGAIVLAGLLGMLALDHHLEKKGPTWPTDDL